MRRRQASRRPLVRIFLIPGLLALACLVGLVAGLAGDGLNDLIAAIGLGLPAAVAVWAIVFRR